MIIKRCNNNFMSFFRSMIFHIIKNYFSFLPLSSMAIEGYLQKNDISLKKSDQNYL
jgi:hypothetical protein